MEAAAVIAAVLLGVLSAFQIALAAGVPAGAASWGGAYPGVLPPRLRLASGFAGAVVYPLMALLILDSGGVLDLGWQVGAGWLWFLSAFFLLGTLANGASRSRVERLWAPLTLAVAVCCALIALGT